MSPKDRLNAQLQLRENHVDALDSELQLSRTEANLRRQTSQLGTRVLNAMGAPSHSQEAIREEIIRRSHCPSTRFRILNPMRRQPRPHHF